MGTIKSDALIYEPKKTKTIDELGEIPINLELHDGEGVDKDANAFQYKYVCVDNEEYRVAGVILGQIKEILKAKPDTKTIKVSKTGEGKMTKYQVIQMT